MTEHDQDRKRFVHVPLPQNPTPADIEAFIENFRRLARENREKRSSEQAEDAKDPTQDRTE